MERGKANEKERKRVTEKDRIQRNDGMKNKREKWWKE